jgi:hypothetical protein
MEMRFILLHADRSTTTTLRRPTVETAACPTAITIQGLAPVTAASLIGIEKMLQRLRLQFLGRTEDRDAIVLDEKEIRSADISAAVWEIADIVWPKHAIGLRLIDVDGRVIHEQSRADVGGCAFRPR